jgi:hypothetical protein
MAWSWRFPLFLFSIGPLGKSHCRLELYMQCKALDAYFAVGNPVERVMLTSKAIFKGNF